MRNSPATWMSESKTRYSWTCHCCGRSFDTLPLDLGVDHPLNYYAIPERERFARARLAGDFCIIDDTAFFVRGCVEIPIHEGSRFAWGLWVSVSADSFAAISAAWDKPDRDTCPPYFGWLNAHLPLYPDTINLKTRLHLRPIPTLPFIELEPTDHPLAIEQREGISVERVVEIVSAYSEH